jgi:hypothetical protein
MRDLLYILVFVMGYGTGWLFHADHGRSAPPQSPGPAPKACDVQPPQEK